MVTLSQLSPELSDKSQEPDTKSPALDSQLLTLDSLSKKSTRGTETRLGQALEQVLRLYQDAPLAGVIVVSDGAQNAGVEPGAAVNVAQQAHVPLYTIGIGSTQPQRNVAVRDLVLPTRAFPGDTLSIAGYLQASGYNGREVDVELRRRRAKEPAGSGTVIAKQRVALGPNGEMAAANFEIEPDQPGTFVYQLRVLAPRRRQPARQPTRGRGGSHRSPDARAAVGQRADA